LHVTMCC